MTHRRLPGLASGRRLLLVLFLAALSAVALHAFRIRRRCAARLSPLQHATVRRVPPPARASPGLEPAALPPRVRVHSTFCALLLRDIAVLDKDLPHFMVRALTQPLLLVFVFTYVLPKIRSVGGRPPAPVLFSTVLVVGVVTLSIFLYATQNVALPLTNELGATREIDDRVLAPMPVPMVAVQKMLSGALTGLLAASMVFPVAAVVPATPVQFEVSWPVLLSVVPLACVTSAAGGLALGTLLEPRRVLLVLSAIVPFVFLGGIFYSWASLSPVPWLKYAVLANPVLYMSEGIRAGLVSSVPHMPLPAIYAALIGSAILLGGAAIRGFERRVRL